MKDLSKANAFITELSKKYPHISPITQEDQHIYDKFFDKSEHTYGNSWLYIIQGMYGIGAEGLGYKYYDGEDLISICFYPRIENPDEVAFFMVRPLGENVAEKVSELGKFVKENFDVTVYAKKLFKDQYDELIEVGFKDIKENPWHSVAIAEDDTYPEIIIDVNKTIEKATNLGRVHQLRRSLSNYTKIINDNKYVYKSYFDYADDALELLDKFFNQRNYLISSPTDYHNIMKKKYNVNYFESLVYEDFKVIGGYISQEQNNSYASLYATITDRSENNYLSDFIIFHLLHNLQNKGIKYLNLGGSEFSSLQDFKKKYLPFKEQKMYWATI